MRYNKVSKVSEKVITLSAKADSFYGLDTEAH